MIVHFGVYKFVLKQSVKLHRIDILAVPDDVIRNALYRVLLAGAATGSISDQADKVIVAEHFVHERAYAVDVFIADLNEYGAAAGEQVSGDGQAVAQVGEVRVDAVSPSVSERFDLLGFSGDVVCVAVSDVSAGG